MTSGKYENEAKKASGGQTVDWRRKVNRKPCAPGERNCGPLWHGRGGDPPYMTLKGREYVQITECNSKRKQLKRGEKNMKHELLTARGLTQPKAKRGLLEHQQQYLLSMALK